MVVLIVVYYYWISLSFSSLAFSAPPSQFAVDTIYR